jgi:hypothetical protein
MVGRLADRRRSAPRWARLWPLLAALVLALGSFAGPGTAAAQQAINFEITPIGSSGVSGVAFLTAEGQGTNARVILAGLRGQASAEANLNGGTCAQPSASVLRLLSLRVDERGRAEGSGRVTIGGSDMALAGLADGQHVIMIVAGGQAVACGAIPALPNVDVPSALLAEGEHQQVMQFNPGAALQKRIFADGFVPNSAEFRQTLEATTFAVQRAEHLRTGVVRVYFAREGDWGNVRFYQRGAALDTLGRALLDEAERRQAIQFNPTAALQKAIFADGFVPNSGEFHLQLAWVSYAGQRAEHLSSGRVRVYYAVAGQWNNVTYAERPGGSAN